MRRLIDLGTQNWAGPGDLIFDLDKLPETVAGSENYVVEKLLFHCRMDATTTAGGEFTLAAQWLWLSLITMISELHSYIPGMRPEMLMWLNRLGHIGNPSTFATIPVSQDNDISYHTIVIPLDRPTFRSDDMGVPVSMLRNATVKIHTGPAAVDANVTVNAFRIIGYAVLKRRRRIKIPSLPVMFERVGRLSDTLPVGVYPELFLTPKEPFAAATDLTNIRIVADGESIIKSVGPEGLLQKYLADHFRHTADGSDLEAMWAGGACWQDGYASISRLPLLWMDAYSGAGHNELSRAVDSGRGKLIIDCDGTVGDFSYVGRFNNACSQSRVSEALEEMGASPQDARYEVNDPQGDPIDSATIINRPGAKILAVTVKGFTTRDSGGRLYKRTG